MEGIIAVKSEVNRVKCVPCHRDMTRPQVVDGADGIRCEG
jgi:hypothetical protein